MDPFLLLFLLFVFCLGTIVGSFSNVVILRLRAHEKGIFLGRSHCPSCKHLLSFLDLVPFFSYVFLRGKCRYCQKTISLQYPTVELLMGVLFLLTTLFHFPFSPLLSDQLPLFSLGLYLFVTAALGIITVYDLLYMEIPDEVSLPTIGILFLSTLLWGFPVPFTDGLLGAGIILAFFGVQILISRGRWLGMGDLRIGAIMGLLLGWQLGLLALFASYVFGSVIVLLLLLGKKRYSLNSEIPFAPFLVLGTLFAWYVGPSVLSWYINGLLGY